MKKILFAILVAAAVISIASCSLSNGSTTPPGAALLIAQESPAQINLDFFIDGLQAQPLAIGYTNVVPYKLIAPGTHTFEFVATGTTTPILLSSQVNLLSNYTYSFFSFDSVNTMQGALVIDNTNAPIGDSAKVRFMQFSPLDSTIDFAVQDSSVISAGRTFNDENATPALDSFHSIVAGSHSFQALLSGTSTSLVNFSENLAAGKVYTIVLTGLTSNNGTPLAQYGLNAYIVQHN